MGTVPNISQNLKRLEKSIRNYFIKCLFNGYECNDMNRKLFELPAEYGGLGIINPYKISDHEYGSSRIYAQRRITTHQKPTFNLRCRDKNKLREIKNGIKCENSKQYQGTLNKIKQNIENDRSRLKLLKWSIEPTACNWSTTIPLMEHDFYLNKTNFWDNIHICYDISLKYLLSTCICGQIFNLEHEFSCKKGGFITLCHY